MEPLNSESPVTESTPEPSAKVGNYVLISHSRHNIPACIVWQVEDGLADGGIQFDKPRLFLAATDTVHVNILGKCKCVTHMCVFSCILLEIKLLLLLSSHVLWPCQRKLVFLHCDTDIWDTGWWCSQIDCGSYLYLESKSRLFDI